MLIVGLVVSGVLFRVVVIGILAAIAFPRFIMAAERAKEREGDGLLMLAYTQEMTYYANNGWYVSRGYSGPWVVVAPQIVPRPVLLVPVNYYRMPPGHWKQWQKKYPPQWGHEWGSDWAHKRSWKDRDDRGHDDHPGKGHDDQRGAGHDGPSGKGHGGGKGKGGH